MAESGRSLSTIVPLGSVFPEVRQFLRSELDGKILPCLGTKSGCGFSSPLISCVGVGQTCQLSPARGQIDNFCAFGRLKLKRFSGRRLIEADIGEANRGLIAKEIRN